MPGIWETIFGSGPKSKKIPNMSPEQMQMMNQWMGQVGQGGFAGGGAPAYQSGMGYLQDLYSQSPEAFSRMQEPYMKQFQQQTVPGLAERFSQAGGRQSSAFNQAMGQAGGNLSSQLGGMFEQMRSQNLGNLLNFANAPFQQGMQMMNLKPFGYETQEGSPGLLGPILGAVGGAAAGPFGSAIGSGAANWMKQQFGWG
jgi:hypothetical protein